MNSVDVYIIYKVTYKYIRFVLRLLISIGFYFEANGVSGLIAIWKEDKIYPLSYLRPHYVIIN